MSFTGSNPKANTRTYTPQSADPTNPVEGMVFRSDGTSRAKGLWEYKNTAWVEVVSSGGGFDTFHQDDFETTKAADFTTGLNATYKTAGTFGGTLSDDTTTEISGTSSIKYAAGVTSTNDWFDAGTITLDSKQKGEFVGISFYADTTGFSVDAEFVVWDNTNSVKLTGSLDVITASTGKTRYSFSVAIPASTVSISYGFHMVNAPVSTESFTFDDIEFSTNPFVYKNLINRQHLEFDDVASDFQVRTGEFRFPTDFNISNFTGASILEVEDDSGNSRTKFNALSKCTVDVAVGCSANAGSEIVSIYKNGTLIIRGSHVAAANETTFVSGTINLDVGDYLTVGMEGAGVAASSAQIRVLLAAEADAEHVITPLKVPRQYSEADGDFTFTGTNWTTTVATAVYYKTGDGKHRVKGNVRGSLSVGAAALTLTFSGVTFKNIANFLQAIASRTSGGASESYANPNASTISVDMASSTAISLSYDVELESKPTWADDVSTNYLAAVPVQLTAYLKDVKAVSTEGGTFTTGAYRTRDLNTVEGDSEIVTLAANQFTLQPGKYKIHAMAPAHRVDRHHAILRNITDSTTDIIGKAQFSSNAAASDVGESIVAGQIEITSAKTFEIQHDCDITFATTGFGISNSLTSSVYTVVEITKIK